MTSAHSHRIGVIISSISLLLFIAGLFFVSAPVTTYAANSCTTMQSSQRVSGTLTTLSGAGSCQEKCTAHASALGQSVNCQIQNTYVPDPPIWMCFPDGWGGEICGNYYPSTGTTVETCSAGTGAIAAGAVNQSAASCAYIPNPTVNLTSNFSTVSNGQSVMLSWSSTNAVSCNAVASGITSGSKTQVVNAGTQTSVTYSVTCLNASGVSASDSVTISVSNPSTPASCSPWDTAKAGTGVQVASLSTTNAASCINTCASYSESNPGNTYTCSIYSSGSSYQTSGVITPPEPAWGDSNSTTECRIYAGASTVPSSSYTLNRLGEGYTPGAAETYRQTCTNGSCTNSGSWSANIEAFSTSYGCGQTKYCWTDATYNNSAGQTTCSSAPTGSPDLRASNLQPTTATVGAAVTFSATIANTGTLPTGAGFTNRLQIASDAGGSVVIYTDTEADAALAASASDVSVFAPSYSFSSAGTYYARVCADTTNAINTESDETNNCTSWTAVTVTTASASITAPDCTIAAGATSCTGSVTWTSSNTTNPLSVSQNGSEFSTAATSVGANRTLSFGLNTFTFSHNNGVQLATDGATAACQSGTTWNGSQCAGTCGTAAGGTYTTAPATNQCGGGTLAWTDQYPTDGGYNWTCGGVTSCVATVTSGPTPTATPGSCSTGEMSVSWSAVSGATGYDLQYQTSPSGAWTVISNVTSPYIVTGLTTGVTYNFQVRHKAGTLVSPWSAYATAAAPSACVVSACSPPASNLSLVVGVQAADGAACNNRVGLPQYTPNVALGGLSAWANDTGGADMTCSKVCASPGPVSKDSRFCVQVLNNGAPFTQQCTGWASEGGGWSAYSPGKDNDQIRVSVENRDMPAGQTLNSVRVGIQLAKGTGGACDNPGIQRFTPIGGGDSGWALDGSNGDYDCARVYINGVVSSSNLTSENLIKTSGAVQEGQTLNFTANARNNGANSTGVGFSDVFEYRYVDNTGAFSNIKTEANGALAAGATDGDTATYTIPAGTAGQTLYVQHCVDSTGAVGESNETVADQCEQINLGTVSPPPVITASVDAPDCTIASGASSCAITVTWTSSNVTSPFSVRQGATQFSTAASSVGVSRTLSYGTTAFTFHHNNGVQLTTDNATAACVSGTAWNGMLCTTVPGVVTGLTATPQACASGDITLTWSAVAGASGYDVQIDGGAWTNLGNVTTYNHLNQVAGSAHTYSVRAWNVAGAGTAATVSSTIPSDCPGTLTVTAGACDTNQITASWAAVSGATGYDVQYQLSPSGAWTVLTSVTSPRIVSGLNPGSTYNFQVRAKNAGSASAWSSYGTTNAPAVCAPAVPDVPTNLSATPQACGTNRLTLDWNDAANAASYSVYYSSGLFVGNSVGSNYTFTGTANQSYTFYVRANNSVGVQSANSATFSGTVAGACPVPSANISGAGCSIPAASNSCTAYVTWTSSNTTNPISVRQNGVQFATNANQATGLPVTIARGTDNFTFHHSGGTQVGSTHQISASCVASAPWNATLGMCVAAPINPGLSLSASPSIVRRGQTATISWSMTTSYSMNCTVFGPKISTVTFDPTDPAAPNNIVTGPITSKSEYFFRCTTLDGTTSWTDSAVVETVGVIEET